MRPMADAVEEALDGDQGRLARPSQAPRRMEPAGGARGAPYPVPVRHAPSGGAAGVPPGPSGGLPAGWYAGPMQGVDGVVMMPSPPLPRAALNGDPAAGPLAMPSLDVLQNFHESRPLPLENTASNVLYQMSIDADAAGRYHHGPSGGLHGTQGYGFGAVHPASTTGASTAAPMMRPEPEASHLYPVPGGYIVELPPTFFAAQPWWPGSGTPMFAYPQPPTMSAAPELSGGDSSSGSATSSSWPRARSAAMDDL